MKKFKANDNKSEEHEKEKRMERHLFTSESVTEGIR